MSRLGKGMQTHNPSVLTPTNVKLMLEQQMMQNLVDLEETEQTQFNFNEGED